MFFLSLHSWLSTHCWILIWEAMYLTYDFFVLIWDSQPLCLHSHELFRWLSEKVKVGVSLFSLLTVLLNITVKLISGADHKIVPKPHFRIPQESPSGWSCLGLLAGEECSCLIRSPWKIRCDKSQFSLHRSVYRSAAHSVVSGDRWKVKHICPLSL